ncbi:RNA polymerase sigma factor [Flavitalea sp. BT771]|uniref:RNA polymerase sigma factor n=2 Tax=Flavitalea sp. BT771 TaxID=3063329 RepID=UPI0026E2EDF8|nr:RNA polymerase sigma-70 factor [Flavitalea sp. BT771]
MPTDMLHNEKALLRQVAQRDEPAFRTLFAAYRDRLYAYILGIIRSKEVAEELVMDVFLKIWLAKDLVTEIENFDAFLFRIAYNKSIDFLRSAARDPVFRNLLWNDIQQAGDARADSVVMQHEYENKLREAVALLSPQRKEVYLLSREKGFSHADIARKLSLSKSTVNNHIVESQRFIRTYLISHMDLAMTILLLSRIKG